MQIARNVLADRLRLLADPVEDIREAEFVALHRAVDEFISVKRGNFEDEAIEFEEGCRRCECYALIAVDEAVIICQRFHQGGSFGLKRIVVTSLGTKNGGLDCVLVAYAVQAAEAVDQEMLHLVDFGDGQIDVRHLLRQTLEGDRGCGPRHG